MKTTVTIIKTGVTKVLNNDNEYYGYLKELESQGIVLLTDIAVSQD